MLEGMLQTVKGMASQHDGKGSLSNSADAFGDSPPQRSLPPHYNDTDCGLMSDGGDGGGGLFLGDSSSGWGNLGNNAPSHQNQEGPQPLAAPATQVDEYECDENYDDEEYEEYVEEIDCGDGRRHHRSEDKQAGAADHYGRFAAAEWMLRGSAGDAAFLKQQKQKQEQRQQQPLPSPDKVYADGGVLDPTHRTAVPAGKRRGYFETGHPQRSSGNEAK